MLSDRDLVAEPGDRGCQGFASTRPALGHPREREEHARRDEQDDAGQHARRRQQATTQGHVADAVTLCAPSYMPDHQGQRRKSDVRDEREEEEDPGPVGGRGEDQGERERVEPKVVRCVQRP